MNRLLFVLLTLMAVNTPMAQAQYASRNQQGSSGVQLKTIPIKAFDWSLKTLNMQRTEYWFFWDFEDESQMDDWTTLDYDGDGYGWTYHFNDEPYGMLSTHSGKGSISSASFDLDLYQALTPDNWLISPLLPLNGTLTFWACGQDSYYPDEVFSVYVCVGTPNSIDDFVQVTNDIKVTSTMTEYSFDLSDYYGLEGCIAIRHYNCSDMFKLVVDDIGLALPKTPVPEISCQEIDGGMLILATGEGSIYLYCDGIPVAEGMNSAEYFIPSSEEDEEHEFTATAQLDGYEVSDWAILNVMVPGMIVPIETPAPEITYELTDESMIITATGEGTVTLYIQFIENMTGHMTTETVTGEGMVVYEIPRGEEDTYVNVWAVAVANQDAIPGMTGIDYYIVIPAIELPIMYTDPPIITCEEIYNGVLVTAYGEGHICLYCDGELVAEGYGEACYLIPYGYDFMTYEITATAQGEGMEISEMTYCLVEVPWIDILPPPEFVLEEGDDYYTIYVIADAPEVYLFCDGIPVENPYMIERTDEDQVHFLDAYAAMDGFISDVVTLVVVVPAKVQATTGDLNGDGKVTITDVTTLIDYLLSHDSGDVNPVADVNHDGKVTVADVTALINYLLSGTW